MRRRGAWVAGALLLLSSCTSSTERAPAPDSLSTGSSPPAQTATPTPDKAALSQQVLDRLISTPEHGPGCAASAGRHGKVIWQGTHGMADVEAGTPISASTIFDIGSVTKQFVAATILMLAAEDELDLDDPVSDHVDGLSAWGDEVTIDQLIHHTSGVPEYEVLLHDQGHERTEKLARKQLFTAIAEIKELDFEPGTRWAYSNSNYVLLGHVIEQVTGAPLDEVMADRVFGTLGLDMVLAPVKAVDGQARSYVLSGAGYERLESPWDISGAGGIQSTVADLVRWADNYRTGSVGGRRLLGAQVADPVKIAPDDDWRYGAGILVLPDGSLLHNGAWDGFLTQFRVSADRERVLVVACNFGEANWETLADELAPIWLT